MDNVKCPLCTPGLATFNPRQKCALAIILADALPLALTLNMRQKMSNSISLHCLRYSIRFKRSVKPVDYYKSMAMPAATVIVPKKKP